jgi:hypothetical protein
MADMDWKELLDRTAFIRKTFADAKVPLKAGEGLERSLTEAEALARGEKLPGEPSAEVLNAVARDAHVIYALTDSLKTCADAGLDIVPHLKQITTGTTDYGTPASGTDAKRIYFKDFEFELFTAAALLRAGLAVQLADPPNDPRGDLIVGPLRIELKHPNSLKQLLKLAGKFQKALATIGGFGIFATGIEDAFVLGDQPPEPTQEDYVEWLERKRDTMERFGLEFIHGVAEYDRIVAVTQTTTVIERYAGSTRLRRLGNSLIFDDDRCKNKDAVAIAEKVAKVFNPRPRQFSKIPKP